MTANSGSMKQVPGVTEMLTALIDAWPTLFRSRMAALDRVFTSSDYEFSQGGPLHRYAGEVLSRDNEVDEPVDEELVGSDKAFAHTTILSRHADRDAAVFIRRHASHVAQAEHGRYHDFVSTPDFSTYKLNSIAIDKLNDEWRKALVEYCNEIISISEEKTSLRKKLGGTSAQYIEAELVRLASSKEVAKECLMRLGQGKKDEDAARRQMIEKVRREAEALGFKLEKMS